VRLLKWILLEGEDSVSVVVYAVGSNALDCWIRARTVAFQVVPKLGPLLDMSQVSHNSS